MFADGASDLVRTWTEEWKNSLKLQGEFPSLATFLVFRAQDSPTFRSQGPRKTSLFRAQDSRPGASRP